MSRVPKRNIEVGIYMKRLGLKIVERFTCPPIVAGAVLCGLFFTGTARADFLSDAIKIVIAPQVYVAERVAPGPSKRAEDNIMKAASAAAGTVSDAAKLAVQTSVAPVAANSEAMTKALDGRDIRSVADSYSSKLKDSESSVATVLHSAATTGLQVERLETDPMRDIATALAGDTGAEVINGVTVPNRLATMLGISSADYAADVLQGKDPAMLLALPLAVALRDAAEVYKVGSRPIPASVALMLKRYYSEELVDSARYNVGKVDISIPTGVQLFAKDNAVSLPGIIVFPSEPGTAENSLFWWAHEMRHLQQYREMGGAEGFAWAYIKEYRTLEADADATGQAVVARNIDYKLEERQLAQAQIAAPVDKENQVADLKNEIRLLADANQALVRRMDDIEALMKTLPPSP
jgi:hypothetical protein